MIYVKDGMANQVALTETQNDMLQSALNTFTQPIHIEFDAPLGEVIISA